MDPFEKSIIRPNIPIGKNKISTINGTALIDLFGSSGKGACRWHSEILPPNTVAHPELKIIIKIRQIETTFFIGYGFFCLSLNRIYMIDQRGTSLIG